MKAATFESQSWPEDVIQLLDDHHLVALSGSAKARQQFRSTLMDHLTVLAETEVVGINGAAAVDLPSFCRQLERQFAVQRAGAHPWWRDVNSVIEVLRSAPTRPKRRYFIWHDADAMLETDMDLFCRLVNAFFGVAAEYEHINPDPLVLQRVVFIGGEKLGAYAEDANGQFRRWHEDGEDSPFWEVVSVLVHPPVMTYRIGS